MAHRGLTYLRNNALGALALFVALGGTSYAATGGFSSAGTLRACANEEGRLKLLKSGEHCKRGTKSVSWSQLGRLDQKALLGLLVRLVPLERRAVKAVRDRKARRWPTRT